MSRAASLLRVSSRFLRFIRSRRCLGLALLVVLSSGTPARAQFGPFEAALADFDAEVARQVARDGAGCASVAVFEGDRVLWSRGWGWVDIEAGVPCVADSIGRTGSISKSFTAVALMQLVDRGLVDLDDPVADHLPEIRELADRPEGAPPVTFRMLASHTAGLVREPRLEGAASGSIYRWEEKVLESIPHTAFRTEPAAEYHYSNIGFGMLGLALSRVAGVPFMELVKTRIFRPLGMGSSTFVVDTPELWERLSVGYSRDRESGRVSADRATREHLGRGYKVPNGGIYSTVADLARFASGVMGTSAYPILSDESRRALMTPRVPADSYGLGFQVREEGGVTIVGHGGSVAGYNADLRFDPRSGLGVATLRTTSYSPPTGDLLGRLLEARGRELTGTERDAEGRHWLEARRARREIAGNLRRMEEAAREGDAAAIAAFYADDALLVSGGTRVEGREAIDDYWARIGELVDWELEVRDTTGTGEIVHQSGRSRLTLRRDGEERTSVVDFLLVWKRQGDGGYRIVVDSYHPPGWR